MSVLGLKVAKLGVNSPQRVPLASKARDFDGGIHAADGLISHSTPLPDRGREVPATIQTTHVSPPTKPDLLTQSQVYIQTSLTLRRLEAMEERGRGRAIWRDVLRLLNTAALAVLLYHHLFT